MKKSKLFLMLLALMAFGPTAWAQWTGSGTSSDPYLITSTEDWNTLATNVENANTYNTYSGTYFKLTEDITISEMVGKKVSNTGVDSDDYRFFCGNFNGNGHTLTLNLNASENICAPFRYINGATIRYLIVDGTITGNGCKQLAGIAGMADGYIHITSCWVKASMTSSFSGDSSIAGLMVQIAGGGRVYFTNCLFTGSFNCPNANKLGGFVGWTADNGIGNYTNCLFKPSSVTIGSTEGCSTFARLHSGGSATFTKAYYDYRNDNNFVTNQGTVGTSMTNNEYLTEFGSGWEIVTENNVEMVVPVVPSLRPFTGAGTEESPYQIANATDWNNLAYNVSTCEENYSGKYFILTNDINVSSMVGTYTSDSDYKAFRVTFDGNGHTVTINVSGQKRFAAPFKCVNGVTIKNLRTAGTIDGTGNNDGKLLAGIVGVSFGNTNIFECISSASITTDYSQDAALAGIVAAYKSGDLTVEGCVFNGSMIAGSSDSNRCGGIVGYRYGGSCSVSNSVFAPTALNVSTGDTGYSATFARTSNSAQVTITNCYYTQTLGAVQGKQARTITGSNVTVENAGASSSGTTIGVIGYGTGIKYNNVLYAGNGDNVSLSFTAPEGYAISTVSYTYEGGSETTINPVNGVYSFTMPDANVTINATLWNVYTKDITAYTSAENGWYLIASPIGTVSPENVTHMTENTFDIYRFNQNPAITIVEGVNKYLEWENWKRSNEGEGGINHYHFNLEPGRGYLYANSGNVTLTFIGTPYDGDGKVTLVRSNSNGNNKTNMLGWNLIGNPFGVTAYIDRDFYVMNTEGSDIVAAERADYHVEAMEGIFVQASEDGETLTFSIQAPGKGHIQKPEPEQVVLNLSRDCGSVIDRAIVRMGEGQTLPKFQIRENSTKLYIPQGSEEYAIATSNGQGEMPLNFKAKEDGSYTLTVNPVGVEISYLHLIDNMTGADIDLLQTSEYTFKAKTTDYESRFRLLFSAGSVFGDEDGDNAAFAFIRNGEIIITEANANATLQIVDVMGRVIVSGDAKHCVSTTVMMPGVYVLRFVNGNDVKTQKMIIQ